MASETNDIVTDIAGRISDPKIAALVKESLKISVDSQETRRKRASSSACEWLAWARSHPLLKVVTAPIPLGVLPCGQSGLLHDVRVSSRGPDDEIFDNNAEIRQKVARGNCFLDIESSPHAGTSCVIYALKKFTGGLGDDDDRVSGNNYTWQRYFLKPLEEAKYAVATRKANGEAAHLSARKIGDEYILFGGSKNVHMAFKCKEDIKRYGEDQRYNVASEVNGAIVDLLDSMASEDRNRLLEFLSVTGYTAIFEILNPDHQHVEDLSHLKSPLLQFITWTSSDLDPPLSKSLSCVPPHVGIEVARVLNIPTVEYSIVAIEDVDDRMKEIRSGYGYEGEVLYFLDDDNSVIGLLKKKTIWYIVCRAIREKVRAAANAKIKRPDFKINVCAHKIERRINEIQTWLGLEDQCTAKWKVLGTDFLRWCIHGLDTNRLKFSDVADQFPRTWGKFLEETGKTDRIQPGSLSGPL